jgi:hypothetical protein
VRRRSAFQPAEGISPPNLAASHRRQLSGKARRLLFSALSFWDAIGWDYTPGWRGVKPQAVFDSSSDRLGRPFILGLEVVDLPTLFVLYPLTILRAERRMIIVHESKTNQRICSFVTQFVEG